MSAQWRQSPQAERRLEPMTTRHLDAVVAIENQAYEYPWTRGNFIDSLAAGYPAQRLLGADDALLGYFIAMAGVGELHLLNLTVAPGQQGRGHARFMLVALLALCRSRQAQQLWLEVRASNARALSLYRHCGFHEVGSRKAYYPAHTLLHPQRREDAVVMSLQLGDVE